MPNKISPLKPKEVSVRKSNAIPDVVIEVFNNLIEKKFDGDSAEIKQKDIVEALVQKGLQQEDIFANGWLDVEDLFRKKGWKVEYDKPGYNEFYDASFIFEAK